MKLNRPEPRIVALLLIGPILFSVASCRALTPAAGSTATDALPPATEPPTAAAIATAAPASATPPASEATGRIVYTCQIFAEATRNQICLLSPDGASPTRLTDNNQADHFYPSWSPDGEAILFSSNLDGGYEIFEQPLEGPARRLTQQGRAYAPAVSPDGSRLAYTVRQGEDAALWVANRDGSEAHWLIGQAWDATWSPDGAWILHASDRGGSIQLWVVTPDGGALRQVTQLDGLRGRSDWSPAGTRLATYAGTPWQREIVTFDPQGEAVRWLTQGGNNLAPSFSPYGGWLTFTSYLDRYRDVNGCEIYIMNEDGYDRRRLTDNTFCDWQPRWGP